MRVFMKCAIYLLVVWMVAGLSSCCLFGLDYQFDYENESSPVTKEMDMTCYEFVRSRSNLDMVLMYEAINRAEMQEFYETDNLTYFLLDDEEFASWLSTKKYASVASVPKSVLQTMLKGYTLPGLYHSADLTTTPIDALGQSPPSAHAKLLKAQHHRSIRYNIGLIHEYLYNCRRKYTDRNRNYKRKACLEQIRKPQNFF